MGRRCDICEARYLLGGRCENWPLCPRQQMHRRGGEDSIAWRRRVWADRRAACLMDRSRRRPLPWRQLRVRLVARVFFLRLFRRVRSRRWQQETHGEAEDRIAVMLAEGETAAEAATEAARAQVPDRRGGRRGHRIRKAWRRMRIRLVTVRVFQRLLLQIRTRPRIDAVDPPCHVIRWDPID